MTRSLCVMLTMAEMSLSETIPDIIVGAPICRRTSFVLDKFLSNQQEIQQACPRCRLVLACDEPDFITELEGQLQAYDLRGEVITYETTMPADSRSRVWSITAGREALRQYALSHGSDYLLFLDCDMVFSTDVVGTINREIRGFDVVASGYRLPHWGGWGFANGCLMLSKEILDRITFRCYEFKNGQVIFEDQILDMDLFRCHARVKKGIFVFIKHYLNDQEYEAIEPRPVGWLRTMTNNLLIRYILIKASLLTRYDVAGKLHRVLYKRSKVR